MLFTTIAALALAPAQPPAKPSVRTIPLASAFSTIENMGELKRVVGGGDGAAGVDADNLKDIRSGAARVGSPSIFLVRGDDIRQAVSATARVYGRGWDTAAVVPSPRLKEDQAADVWVATFLGNGASSPPIFEIKRIEVTEKAVRVVFGRPRNVAQSQDTNHYFVWANLGRLPPAKYQLQLIDADDKGEAVLSRKVLVK